MSPSTSRPLRLAAGLALAAAAGGLPAPAAQAAPGSLTRLGEGYPDAALALPDGTVRVGIARDSNHGKIDEVRVPATGDLGITNLLADAPDQRFSAVGLTSAGSIVGYTLHRLPKPRVRIVVRDGSTASRPLTISTKAHAASMSSVTASASGAATILYFQYYGAGKRGMDFVTRSVDGQLSAPQRLPGSENAWDEIVYNDAGDGALVTLPKGGHAGVEVRRIGRDGSVADPITVDPSGPGGIAGDAAIAADGRIGVAWYTGDDTTAGDVRFASIAPGSPTADPATVLGKIGDTSDEFENLSVALSGDQAVIVAGTSIGGSAIRVFAGPVSGPTLQRTYASGKSGVFDAAAVTGTDGGVHVFWFHGVGKQDVLEHVHAPAGGAWPAASEVAFSTTGLGALDHVIALPGGGAAAVIRDTGKTRDGSFDPALVRVGP